MEPRLTNYRVSRQFDHDPPNKTDCSHPYLRHDALGEAVFPDDHLPFKFLYRDNMSPLVSLYGVHKIHTIFKGVLVSPRELSDAKRTCSRPFELILHEGVLVHAPSRTRNFILQELGQLPELQSPLSTAVADDHAREIRLG